MHIPYSLRQDNLLLPICNVMGHEDGALVVAVLVMQRRCECRRAAMADWLHGGCDECLLVRSATLWLLPFTLL